MYNDAVMKKCTSKCGRKEPDEFVKTFPDILIRDCTQMQKQIKQMKDRRRRRRRKLPLPANVLNRSLSKSLDIPQRGQSIELWLVAGPLAGHPDISYLPTQSSTCICSASGIANLLSLKTFISFVCNKKQPTKHSGGHRGRLSKKYMWFGMISKHLEFRLDQIQFNLKTSQW